MKSFTCIKKKKRLAYTSIVPCITHRVDNEIENDEQEMKIENYEKINIHSHTHTHTHTHTHAYKQQCGII